RFPNSAIVTRVGSRPTSNAASAKGAASRRAPRAQPDEVEAMVLRREAGEARRVVDGGRNGPFDGGGGREILHPAAVRTHEMMVVAVEIPVKFVAGEVVVRHEPVHDAGLFEHREVAVERTLGQA